MSDRCGIKVMLLLLNICVFFLLLSSCLMSEDFLLSPPVQINNLCSEDPGPCLSLSYLAHNISEYLRANSTLMFLPGNHSLESKLFIANISVLTMFSINSSAMIICDHFGRFEFDSIGIVNISGLTFLGCAGSKFKSVDQLTLESSSVIGREGIGGTSLYLIETSGCISGGSFKFNSGNNIHSRSSRNHVDGASPGVTVGGALAATNSSVFIIDSRFEENSAGLGGCIFSELHSNITV